MSTSNTDDEISEEETEEAESSVTEKYRFMKLNTDFKTKEQLDIAEGGSEQSTEKTVTDQDDVLPSKEKFEKYIYYPSPWGKGDAEMSRGGKWLLFASGDLDKLDYAWIVLQRLWKDGTITKIKSSTATDSVNGVTMCYTADYENKDIVKKAADEIRKLIDYDCIMYYKSNQSSMDGKYCKYGDKKICVYMHTLKGGFYEKDRHNRWTCLNLEESQNILLT